MKPTIKNQVIDSLQWSSDEYDKRFFDTFWHWCWNHGKYPSVSQQLLANSVINKWFIIEFQKKEIEFLNLTNAISPNKLELLRTNYKVLTAEVIGIYPSALMQDHKRNKGFSNSLNNTVYYAN